MIGGITQTEFVQWTDMTKVQFLRMINRRLTVRQALEMRRNLHIAMTEYRKSHPADDPRIWKAVVMAQKLEALARNYFMLYKMDRVRKEQPHLTRQGVKIEAKKQWEKLLKEHSY